METTIVEVLQNEGWNFDQVSDDIYQTLYNGDNGEFYVHLNLSNFNSSLILGNSFFPGVVEKNFISQAAWQLNAINLKISIGSFQIDLKSGKISYRAGIYFFNTAFQMDMVRNVLNTLVSYTNQHYIFINGLLKNEV